MKYLLLLAVILPTVVFAGKKIEVKDMSVLGKIDESNFKQTKPSKTGPLEKKIESKFSVSCKDSTGKEYKNGESGYDTCVSGIKAKNELNQLNSGLNRKDSKDTNNAIFNYKIGD